MGFVIATIVLAITRSILRVSADYFPAAEIACTIGVVLLSIGFAYVNSYTQSIKFGLVNLVLFTSLTVFSDAFLAEKIMGAALTEVSDKQEGTFREATGSIISAFVQVGVIDAICFTGASLFRRRSQGKVEKSGS